MPRVSYFILLFNVFHLGIIHIIFHFESAKFKWNKNILGYWNVLQTCCKAYAILLLKYYIFGKIS